jgi:hypothetical protein
MVGPGISAAFMMRQDYYLETLPTIGSIIGSFVSPKVSLRTRPVSEKTNLGAFTVQMLGQGQWLLLKRGGAHPSLQSK